MPTVSVACITCNHEPTIAEAIDSFLMQKTKFPIEIVIGVDHSDDNTLRICREYQKKHKKIIRIIEHEERVGMMKNFIQTLKSCKGKYIALCEGDDYWTDPLKLAIQVRFLEDNPNISMTYHAAAILQNNVHTGEIVRGNIKNRIFKSSEWDKIGHPIPTASIVFRKTAIDYIPEWFINSPVGDIPLILLLSQYGSILYIDKIMSIRRFGVPGSWTQTHKVSNRTSKAKHIISMLHTYDGFNTFTNHRYYSEVLFKQLLLLGKLRKYTNYVSIISFLLENKQFIKKLSFRKRIFYLIWVLDPAIIDQFNRSTLMKVLKRSIL